MTLIETLRSLTKEQRYAVIDIVAVALCAVFILGYASKALVDSCEKRPGTWAELVSAMPADVKETIALDYCVAHRRMCRNLPLSSPTNPADEVKK